MSTDSDAQTCKFIVLGSNINSMSKFKQIIRRGSRINEAFGKIVTGITSPDTEQACQVLDALLDKYADEGIENIKDMKILQAIRTIRLATGNS